MMKSTFFLVVSVTLLAVTTAQSPPSLRDLIIRSGTLKTLRDLLNATDLLTTVGTTPNLTIFAPTDYAFRKTASALGCQNVGSRSAVVTCLSNILTPAQVIEVLQYHVVPGYLNSTEVMSRNSFTTLAGKKFLRPFSGIRLIDLAVGIPDPSINTDKVDLMYKNGVVHVINRVLLPFINLAKPCDLIGYRVAMANYELVTLSKLTEAGMECRPLRLAVRDCPNKMRCWNQRAKTTVKFGLKLGKLVNAVTTCETAAAAATQCMM